MMSSYDQQKEKHIKDNFIYLEEYEVFALKSLFKEPIRPMNNHFLLALKDRDETCLFFLKKDFTLVNKADYEKIKFRFLEKLDQRYAIDQTNNLYIIPPTKTKKPIVQKIVQLKFDDQNSINDAISIYSKNYKFYQTKELQFDGIQLKDFADSSVIEEYFPFYVQKFNNDQIEECYHLVQFNEKEKANKILKIQKLHLSNFSQMTWDDAKSIDDIEQFQLKINLKLENLRKDDRFERLIDKDTVLLKIGGSIKLSEIFNNQYSYGVFLIDEIND
ncbi:UNKNOWN [Stylonychia lemnae]|uniref:Uncharacterized protein n=1 Tax=Stylonychia lemnae TaxID=5949 RepID=A0A078ANJ0_STYLE|nr:UNKNOWN [Stylonychia lemnae]|eukprot:CDW83491.1 UNKNOWN [Stylonychia lemnae]